MNLNRMKYSLLMLTVVFAACQSQKAEKYTAQNPCISKQTCRECIQTKSCAWCFQPEFDDRPRCFQPSMTSTTGGCDEAFTYMPDGRVSYLENDRLSRAKGGAALGGSAAGGSYQESASSASGSFQGSYGSAGTGTSRDVVQISPQKVQLQLRINEMQKLEISYSQAEDYPVDLYYLMDLSKSMENDKEKLSALGDLLSNTMRNITSNFRLGFGSFVDKVVMPYVSTVPKNLASPCDGCAAPYGFINDMSLSMDTAHFSDAVRNAKVSGNLDAPEGGFDAIMQAVVCRKEIGWREKARRLLVFSTDAGFHFAGDGKLGGIVQPNDGYCHLDNNGKYTYSSVQDYPSISQINLKVKQNQINVIFAVTAEQISVYEKLQENIEGASSGVLTADSSNVVDLVKNQYDKISSSVEMKDNSNSAVQITYYSSCLDGGARKQTNKCDGLKVGDVVQFSAEIVVTECPEDPREWKQTFQIYPVGINESLTVELEMLCDCPCERPGHPSYEENSLVCSQAGLYACGVCMCEPGRFGRRCECSAAGGVGGVELTNACRPRNDTGGQECSGRGHCVCGQCECDKLPNPEEQITGPFCECDNFSCDRNRNMICSGAEHGTCVCGACQCKPGWSGVACECSSSVDTCIAPGSTEICSGHGTCECGLCMCNVGNGDEGHYSGRYCDSCTTCPGRCDQFKDCVMCQYYKQGKHSEAECNATCNLEIIPVQTVIQDESKGEHKCTYYDDNDCLVSYVYYYNETNKVYINTLEKPDCPPAVFILGIVLGVIAAIVLVGLALLMLWKMVTTIHDRREFARFEKERMMAKWDTGENPIYKQATSTFKNPTYAGK